MLLALLGILLFLALDVATLVVLARETSGWWVLGALVAGLVAGGLTFRVAGPLTAVRVAGRLRRGEIPGRELVDALLMLAAGVLFLLPGLLSDAVALVLVVPGLRAIPRALVVRGVRRRSVVVGHVGFPAGEAGGPERPGTIDADFERRD